MQAERLTAQMEGMLCSLTNRVMVISPMPDRVQSLLASLSTGCFDVFALHSLNKGMLTALQPELLIYDAMPLPIHTVGAGHTLRGGEELLSAAQAAGVPVLMLVDSGSSAAQQEDVLSGAEYLLWPAEPEEALERINRILRERPAQPSSGLSSDELVFKDIRVHLRKMKVERGGVSVNLTKTEYDLLLHFLNSDGTVLTRETLLDNIWGMNYFGGSNIVDVHIKSLRKKLKDSAVSPKYIVTVRGAGYRLADDMLR
ncbi:DNA-binding response regulator [Paenibacillus nanensis]|uniref:DNA-binding response regulator n=1 Tax=Paenibacillus nanensis TaxID=393251 RepID=A0A3A1UVN7_9BACL|nr:response regulator transcription factor [Paenibacillus nanensis]RIX51242.1 DNA-binding response regulator [Paenibacillus nanensis]